MFSAFGVIEPLIKTIKEYLYALLNLKTPKDKELVGLDIGHDYIKLLKIKRTESSYSVENFSIMPYSNPINSVLKNSRADNAKIAVMIGDMFKQAGLTTKQVAIAIPRSIVIFKNITIDNRLTSDEIESRAWIEVNRHFPDLVGKIYLDFFIEGPSQEDSSKANLMLVACRKSQIEPYLDIIQQAGLQARIVDVDSYALERALPLMTVMPSDDSAVAMLCINTKSSILIVVKSNKLIFSHDQEYDGQRLIAQTETYLKSKTLTDTSDQAMLLNDPAYQEILKNNLISHLRHTLHFFSTSGVNISIRKLVLAGDCVNVPCLTSFIHHEIGIETIIADLQTNLILEPNIDMETFKKYSPGLVLCCGLALSQLEY